MKNNIICIQKLRRGGVGAVGGARHMHRGLLVLNGWDEISFVSS